MILLTNVRSALDRLILWILLVISRGRPLRIFKGLGLRIMRSSSSSRATLVSSLLRLNQERLFTSIKIKLIRFNFQRRMDRSQTNADRLCVNQQYLDHHLDFSSSPNFFILSQNFLPTRSSCYLHRLAFRAIEPIFWIRLATTYYSSCPASWHCTNPHSFIILPFSSLGSINVIAPFTALPTSQLFSQRQSSLCSNSSSGSTSS